VRKRRAVLDARADAVRSRRERLSSRTDDHGERRTLLSDRREAVSPRAAGREGCLEDREEKGEDVRERPESLRV
jgi:hypothetical protein